MNSAEDSASILRFWFGDDDAAATGSASTTSATTARRQARLWWGKDPAADQLIKSRFEASLQAAAGNRLGEWAETPAGMLALILLLDQFPRNIYRGSANAFAFDETARQCCHLGLAQGFDQQLPPLQRVFFYLPLEHSEDIDDQDYSLQLFRALARQSARDEPDAKEIFDGYAGFAECHHVIITRFGRFPHRNQILGRESGAEEIAFLQEPRTSF